MAGIKISTIMDEKIWKKFKQEVKDSRQNISALLNQAVEEFINRRRVRPQFLKAMEETLSEHDDLLKRLAK